MTDPLCLLYYPMSRKCYWCVVTTSQFYQRLPRIIMHK